MRTTFIIVTILLLPLMAAAQKVAVLPVSYLLVWEDKQSEEKAAAIYQEVVGAALENGYEVVPADAVTEAVEADEPADECKSRECLERVRAKLDVNEVIFVSVAEEGMLANVEIYLAVGEGQFGPIGGNFKKLRTGIRAMAKQALGKAPEPPAAEEETGPEEAIAGTDEEAVKQVDITKKRDLKKLNVLPFAITAGVTGALAIAWVVVEAVGFSKLKKLEDNPDYDWSKGDAEKLQAADRALLVTGAVGLAATVVLRVFTDFKKMPGKNKNKVKVGVPTVANGGAMMTFEGRF
jgi:hypothetical protein